MDFQIAGSMAVRRAARQARPALLEPIVEADLNVPGESLGAIMADLGRRRGNVHSLTIRGSARGVRAGVPLAEARGYATDLRSLTQGRGAFTLEFRQYDFVPEALAADIIERRRAEGKIAVR